MTEQFKKDIDNKQRAYEEWKRDDLQFPRMQEDETLSGN